MNDIYLPVTINEMISRLKTIVNDQKNSLTGEESIEDVCYITSECDDDYPPNTILFKVRELQKLNEKSTYGVITVMPHQLTKLVM